MLLPRALARSLPALLLFSLSALPSRGVFAANAQDAAPPLNTGTAWPVARGPSHELHPYRYDPGLVKRIPREFLDDSAACVLYSGTTYLVEPDGTIETITHEITRLN